MGSFVPVYVVDDDFGMLESMRFLLQAFRIPSKSYNDPLLFLQEVDELIPGCILSDMRMPNMSGTELYAALRSKSLDWPIVFMSGHANFETDSITSDGIVDLLEKPFTAEGLMNVIGEARRSLEETVEGETLSRFFARQENEKRRSSFGRVLSDDRAAVSFDNRSAYGQPDSESCDAGHTTLREEGW